ncbi:MAG: hypothetical protein RXQ75_06620 [Acidianus hospitalis]
MPSYEAISRIYKHYSFSLIIFSIISIFMAIFRQLIPNYIMYLGYSILLLYFIMFSPYLIISRYKIYTLFMIVSSIIVLLLISLLFMYSTAYLVSPYVAGFILAVIAYITISLYMIKKYSAELTVNKYEILQSVFLGGYIIVNLITFTLIQYEKYGLLLNILSYALLFGFFLAIYYENKQLK